PDEIRSLPTDQVGLKATNIVGLDALGALFDEDTGTPDAGDESNLDVADAPLANLIDELAGGNHGLIMCMGKGGVGKTTIAAAIAV
ncbi:arsenical pump-driving ATPase, partial [Mycobacterium sp. ITM-2017-0098]